MAKRFTDTDVWDKEWFMQLSDAHKLFWFYLKDKCDQIGVWRPNIRLAKFVASEGISEQEFLQMNRERIVVLLDGKWWLKDFCQFQYGELNDSCKPHKKYIAMLEAAGLMQFIKGYRKGIERVQEEEKDKEEEKEKAKEEEKDTGESVKILKGEDRKPENRRTPEEWVLLDETFCARMRVEFDLDNQTFRYRLKQFSLRKIEDGFLYTDISQPQAGFEKWLNTWANSGYPSKPNTNGQPPNWQDEFYPQHSKAKS